MILKTVGTHILLLPLFFYASNLVFNKSLLKIETQHMWLIKCPIREKERNDWIPEDPYGTNPDVCVQNIKCLYLFICLLIYYI